MISSGIPNVQTVDRIFCARRTFGPLLIAMVLSMTGCSGIAALERQHLESLPHSSVAGVSAEKQPITLPRFLGLDVVGRRTVLVGQVVREKVATAVPALKPVPMSLPVSHPANVKSPSTVVANAHKTHQAKAAKAAKVKAVAMLAEEDCSSNPHVEEGLLAALDDPAAEVRTAAVTAILRSRQGCDQNCKGCCSEPIRRKLTTMVYEKNSQGCWLEPNSKNRRLARLALDAFGGALADCNSGCESFSNAPLEFPSIEIIDSVTNADPSPGS